MAIVESTLLSMEPMGVILKEERRNEDSTLQQRLKEQARKDHNVTDGDTRLKKLLARKADRTKAIVEKRAVRSNRQDDVKSSLASVLEVKEPCEVIGYEKRKVHPQLRRAYSSSQLNSRRCSNTSKWQNSLKDITGNVSRGVYRSRRRRLSNDVDALSKSMMFDNERTLSRASLPGKIVGAVPSLQHSIKERFFLQFDPSNPKFFATVNESKGCLTSTIIRQTDGTTVELQIWRFDDLPTFGPDRDSGVPRSTMLLSESCNGNGSVNMHNAKSSLFKGKAKHGSISEREGKRQMLSKNMSSYFQLSRSSASLGCHVLLDDDSSDEYDM